MSKRAQRVPKVGGAGLPWGIRAVQLDLARHMETVDYVRRYADFAAALHHPILAEQRAILDLGLCATAGLSSRVPGSARSDKPTVAHRTAGEG